MVFPVFQMKISCDCHFDVLKEDSHCGESRGHLSSPHRVRKYEGGERTARAQSWGYQMAV